MRIHSSRVRSSAAQCPFLRHGAGTLLIAQTLVGVLPAQFAAALRANLPLQASVLSQSQTQPAGPVTTNGSVSASSSLLGTPIVAQLSWVAPTAASLACRITEDFSTGGVVGNPIAGSFQGDLTLDLSGPSGAWGTVWIEANAFGVGWPFVDIANDGTNEAVPAPFYGGIGPGAVRYLWSKPVQLGTTPLPVRIVMPAGPSANQRFLSVDVRFQPWSPSASDLGSGCTPNHVGWILGENRAQDYTLAVLPGSGVAAARLSARGYGQAQVFAVDLQSTRLPVGTIGLGNGCDDLLVGVGATAAGIPTGAAPDLAWTLDVPQLPPGLIFFLQHVSLGAIGGTIYFGATNVVRYGT